MMVEAKPYTEDEQDMLQEVVNIAIGQAASSLAKIFDTFVVLSVPQIALVGSSTLATSVTSLIGEHEEGIIGVRQAFYNQLCGEAFAIYGRKGCTGLAEQLGYESEQLDLVDEEVLLDITNVLVGACLCGVAEQLDRELSFTAPALCSGQDSTEELLELRDHSWTESLLVQTRLGFEGQEFQCHLVILMAEDTMEELRLALVDVMELD